MSAVEASKPMRVVPSGQIYRQMFDAQLQLNRSLSRYDSDARIQRLKSRELSQAMSLPLIRLDKEDTQHGILTSRQKSWIGGFPNDPYTENPVLYRQYTQYMNQKLRESDSSAGGKEVRGLPDIIVPSKQRSDIVERIGEGRRQRHESAVEDMHQELSVISTETEPLIETLSAKLLRKMYDDDELITEKLSRIDKDEDVLTYKLEDLYSLWEEVETHSPVRQTWVAEMDVELKKIEGERMNKIKEVFTCYGEKLHKISHLMSPDLQRFMDKESQMINQTVLSNQRSYADLFVRLVSSDVEREKTQRTMWRRRVEDWKSLNTRIAVEEFRDFMKTPGVVTPSAVQNVKDVLLDDQTKLNDQRMDLVRMLSDMKPPNSTKSAVYRWRQDMKKLSVELDNITRMHMDKLHEEYENVCKECLDKVEEIKVQLLEQGICSQHRVSQVIDEYMLPLVGEQQRAFEHNLELMEKLTEDHNAAMEEEMNALFKFSQGAAHLWDVHEIGLARQERGLQEKLEGCRQSHDQTNQNGQTEKEANLDIVMDRMRQDATEVALKDSLIKALTMLDKIRESYEDFHGQQSDIVKTYPDMVQEELDGFDTGVCKFFNVTRDYPRPTELDEQGLAWYGIPKDGFQNKPQSQSSRHSKSGSPANDDRDTTHSNSGDKTTARKKSGRQSQPVSAKASIVDKSGEGTPKTPKTPKEDPHSLEDPVLETLYTERGTEFYVLREPKEPKKEESFVEEKKEEDDEEAEDGEKDNAFLTEMEREASSVLQVPDFIESLMIPPELIMEVKKAIRQNFVEHIDIWADQAIERADSVVIAKCEELNSELDLRLHLHQPRPRRAELDIHNVRAAELVMHSERVSRHCTGMDQSLRDVNHRFKVMNHEHNKLARKFNTDIEALEVIFVNATKSARLVKLQNQVTIELDKFMSVIRASLRQFRQHLDETLQMLRESNARFIKSFKLFSDGGNFCPEEIDEYRKKLEKMSHMIDGSEGNIMSELEGMESKRLEVATKISVEFEDRFKGHMSDLVFMERVARWLTNTQVKVKAEVASSNTQAQRLVSLLDTLERRIDACDKPNLDKEQISATELNASLADIFAAFHLRSEYLNCVKTAPSNTNVGPPSVTTVTTNKKKPEEVAPKVGFSQDPVTGVKGKQGPEDPSVNVIKSILKTQRSAMRFGADAQLDGETGFNPPTMGAMGLHNDAAREKTKSAMSQASSKASDSSKISRKTVDMASRRSQSGHRRISKPAKFDKKYMVFGEKPEDPDNEEDPKHFLAVITRVLRDALDGLLVTAEVYYRQKGSRAVTRPQALQETFEECADIITAKVKSYYTQADVYHNQCLQELRSQLTRLEALGAQVPPLVIAALLKEEVNHARKAQASLTSTFQATVDGLRLRQEAHRNTLRPTMGHPHAAGDLDALCGVEDERHIEYIAAVDTQNTEQQECSLNQSKAFLDRLVKACEDQLVQYDAMLVIDDVEKGRVEPTKYPTSELIRRKNAGEPLDDDEDKDALPRGKANWIGVPSNQFVVSERPSKLQVSPTVPTKKTTLAHSATIKARDKAYLDYKEKFEQMLEQIATEKEKLIVAEKRWEESWEKSVDKIRDLYMTS